MTANVWLGLVFSLAGMLVSFGVPAALLRERTWHYCSETCKVADTPTRMKHESRVASSLGDAMDEALTEPDGAR